MGDYQNPDYSLLGANHVTAYRESNGKVGYMWNGAPTLLLTTKGRKTGEPRTSALIYGEDGEDFVIVASVGGMPNHPAWYLNLLADPHVTLQVKGETFDAVARVANGEDKARLWAMMNVVWPNYDVYQTRTEREIPVVVLARA